MQVFKFQAGRQTGTFYAYDVDRLQPQMKARFFEAVDSFAGRVGVHEARLQQEGLDGKQYRQLLEAARAIDIDALKWVPLVPDMPIFDKANFENTWGTRSHRFGVCFAYSLPVSNRTPLKEMFRQL